MNFHPLAFRSIALLGSMMTTSALLMITQIPVQQAKFVPAAIAAAPQLTLAQKRSPGSIPQAGKYSFGLYVIRNRRPLAAANL